MKVIDLLNKIANGEEVPKHIHIRDVDYYTWQGDVKAYWSDKDENNLLSDLDLSSTDLREDIEIMEEDKKIEKIKILNSDYGNDISSSGVALDLITLKNKTNEIIDYLMENKQ